MKTPRKAVVTKRVSDQQIIDAARWQAFIAASGLPYNQLTPTWLDAFDAQSDPSTASTLLVELVDIAMAQDNNVKEAK